MLHRLSCATQEADHFIHDAAETLSARGFLATYVHTQLSWTTAMNSPPTVRVADLARTLNMSDRMLVARAAAHGISFSVFSRLDTATAEKLTDLLTDETPPLRRRGRRPELVTVARTATAPALRHPLQLVRHRPVSPLRSVAHDLETPLLFGIQAAEFSSWFPDETELEERLDEERIDGDEPPDTPGALLIEYQDRFEDDLRRDLNRLRDRFGDDFCSDVARERLLEHAIDICFPLGLQQQACIANTSNRDDAPYLSLRLHLTGPILESAFPAGVSLCFRGWLNHRRDTLGRFSLHRIVAVSRSAPREFEHELTFIRVNAEQARGSGLTLRSALSQETIDALPAISVRTRHELGNWLGYLDWKERLVNRRLVAIRYIARRVQDDGTTEFLCVAHSNEVLRQQLAKSKRDGLLVQPSYYSNNPWTFSRNPKYRSHGLKLGAVLNLTPVDLAAARDLEPEISPDLKVAAWQAFAPTAELAERIETASVAQDSEEQLAGIRAEHARAVAEQGWLSTSAAGDLALIDRQRQSLNTFAEEGGYAPFLSSYIFDITKARTPEQTQPISRWLSDSLNDDQRSAVATMLSIPDIGLVQGPPGTGKTTVIAEAAFQFALRGMRVLVVSQANLAVDNALERLKDDPEIRAIRLGKPSKVSADLPFHEKNVLSWFYGVVAKTCEERTLVPWTELDAQQGALTNWLEFAQLAQLRATDAETALRESEGTRATLHDALAQEERTAFEAEEAQRTADRLSGVAALMQGQDSCDPWLPPDLTTLVARHLEEHVRTLRTEGFDVPLGLDFTRPEPGECGRHVHRLTSWLNVCDDALVAMKRTLAKLGELAGEELVAPETAEKIHGLEVEKKRLLELLVDDASHMGPYQAVSKELRQLRKERGGVDTSTSRPKSLPGSIAGSTFRSYVRSSPHEEATNQLQTFSRPSSKADHPDDRRGRRVA